MISEYIKKRTLGVGVRDGSRGGRMNLLSMHDTLPYYPTRPKIIIHVLKLLHKNFECFTSKSNARGTF